MFIEPISMVALFIVAAAFLCEYVDSTLGMGYGTTLTPLLLLFGYSPLQVVPAVLLSELCSGLLAGLLHHRVGNVDFALRAGRPKHGSAWSNPLGWLRALLPRELKVAVLLASCGIVGTSIAAVLGLRLPAICVKVYVGVLVLAIGLFTIVMSRRVARFSWRRITALGLVASFNKGISGGGYGPLVASGQMLSGVNAKHAIAITSLAEGLICLVGFSLYYFIGGGVQTILMPYLLIGAVLSVPLSAVSLKKLNADKLRFAIGGLATVLGAVTLTKAIL